MVKRTEKMEDQMNSARAKLSMLRTSPSKLNDVASLIRRMKASDALVQLTFCKRRIAKEVKKCLMSAIANAENNHNLDIDKLVIDQIMVGKSLVMKRFMPRARGRAGKILKPFSNITITLREVQEN